MANNKNNNKKSFEDSYKEIENLINLGDAILEGKNSYDSLADLKTAIAKPEEHLSKQQ